MGDLLMILFIFTEKRNALLNEKRHSLGRQSQFWIFFFYATGFSLCKQPLLFFLLGPKVIVS